MADYKTLRDLTPAPYNPRAISMAEAEDLARSMDEDGDLSGVVVNVRTGHVVGGHQRLKRFGADAPITVLARLKRPDAHGTVAVGYILHGEERWAYREVDWDEGRERRANVKANRLGGVFDPVPLATLLKELSDTPAGLTGLGFEEEDLRSLLARIPDMESFPEDVGYPSEARRGEEAEAEGGEGGEGGAPLMPSGSNCICPYCNHGFTIPPKTWD